MLVAFIGFWRYFTEYLANRSGKIKWFTYYISKPLETLNYKAVRESRCFLHGDTLQPRADLALYCVGSP